MVNSTYVLVFDANGFVYFYGEIPNSRLNCFLQIGTI